MMGMKAGERAKCINYATRLAVLVQGCTSATCPFKVDGAGGIGTANLCRCGQTARDLLDALSERITMKQRKC